MTTTTPAGRLASLLADAAAAVKQPATEKRKTGEVWAELLEVEYESVDYISLIADLNVVLVGLLDTLNKVSSDQITERAKSTYSDRLRMFLRYFQSQMSQPWSQTYSYMDKRNIDDLYVLDSQMRIVVTSGMLSDEEINELKADISDFLADLDRISDIPEELLQVLRQNVEQMRRILSHYKIHGSEKLYEAINQAIGETVVMMQDKFSDHKNKPIMGKFISLLRKVASKSKVMDRIAAGITIRDALLGG